MNNIYLTQVFGATFASFASSKQDFSGKCFVCDMLNVTHKGYKNVIKGLGGDPILFLWLVVHTLNVFNAMNLL